MWFRMKDIFSSNTLFGTSDYTNDIKQGMASDCYFMAGIYGISENDKRFQSIWVTKETNNAGIYAVNAYVRGKPTIITIDDYIPTDYGNPLFAGVGEDGSLWGPVLEKVYARISGTYERTNIGQPTEALRFFTGCPTTYLDLTYYTSNPDYIWQYLQDADNNNYIV